MELEFVTELYALTAGLASAPFFAAIPIFATLIGVSFGAVAKDVFE